MNENPKECTEFHIELFYNIRQKASKMRKSEPFLKKKVRGSK